MPAQNNDKHIALEVTVNNHPGVMSHVCGLFARRAYNVEGIACMPVNGSGKSRIWLLVDNDPRLNQMITQVSKLIDVDSINQHPGDHPVFVNLREQLRTS